MKKEDDVTGLQAGFKKGSRAPSRGQREVLPQSVAMLLEAVLRSVWRVQGQQFRTTLRCFYLTLNYSATITTLKNTFCLRTVAVKNTLPFHTNRKWLNTSHLSSIHSCVFRWWAAPPLPGRIAFWENRFTNLSMNAVWFHLVSFQTQHLCLVT